MRVVGGKHRGCVLFEFKGREIRPTSDRAKEAIFNILQGRVAGSSCLDMFSGSGSLGIEALSRGALEAVFVDNSKESVALTKKNLDKVRENARVIFSDAIAFAERTNDKFDIIFIDPPYADEVSERAVKTIIQRDLLKENGLIVFERDIPFGGAEGAVIADERKYGKAIITFIRKEKACLFAGSFDPVTTGHLLVADAALNKYDKVYAVLMHNPAKNPMFSAEDRLNMMKIAFRGKNVTVDEWSGMLVDYMKKKKIVYNVRGIRDENDLIYEKAMEEYNALLYPEMVYDYVSTKSLVSSTEVRRRLKEGEGLDGYLDGEVLKYIKDLQEKKA